MTEPDDLTEPADRSRLLAVLVVGLGVLGILLLTLAMVLARGEDHDDGVPGLTATAPSSTPPTADASGSAEAGTALRPIAELADPVWVSRAATATKIPERALVAYAGAALDATRAHPSCKVGWNTIAAIGQVESEHGTMNDASIGDDGIASPSIIGVALNGEGVAKVTDTDHGALDDDTVWDHAAGPMQFIPATWEAHAQDGNRDGRPDINNIDDAAATTAEYLCQGGGDLTVAEDWIAAVAAYNDDVEYNNKVADAADQIAAAAG